MKTTATFLASFAWMLLLVSCASDTNKVIAKAPDFESWCVQFKLETASIEDEAEAKASERKVHKLGAQLGAGLSVQVQPGLKIKADSSYSTTSFYELRDSKGSALVKFPSRFSSDGFDGDFRVWVSDDRSLILIYEWIETGVDSHEMYFVFHKEEDSWSARGVDIPIFRGGFAGSVIDDFRNRPGYTGPYGPHVLGIAGHGVILTPKHGAKCRARVEDLKADHPFPFIVG
ncbi:MAG: hypothetical protein ACYC67_18465 [Prosthecobacter sp.]